MDDEGGGKIDEEDREDRQAQDDVLMSWGQGEHPQITILYLWLYYSYQHKNTFHELSTGTCMIWIMDMQLDTISNQKYPTKYWGGIDVVAGLRPKIYIIHVMNK